MQQGTPQLEILDLRHFSAAQLQPLLRDEATRWEKRLHWDYTHATKILLEYLDSRILPGFVALDATTRRILGYAFCVFEGAKAVVGDVYAFGEAESTANPIGDTLLRHMLEMLQATPGVGRVESQLLMYPAGSLTQPFHSFGFRSYPRLFMSCDLANSPLNNHAHDFANRNFEQHNLTLHTWQPAFYDSVSALIHHCYSGHMDSTINDQYQTPGGAQRFLHNIIRFPGCGIFDPENSFVLRDTHTGEMKATLLSSRIRSDVGHITQLCITPALHGRGIGKGLLRHCAVHGSRNGLNSLSLTVTEANMTAQHLYSSNGFTTLHRFEAMVWDKSRALA